MFSPILFHLSTYFFSSKVERAMISESMFVPYSVYGSPKPMLNSRNRLSNPPNPPSRNHLQNRLILHVSLEAEPCNRCCTPCDLSLTTRRHSSFALARTFVRCAAYLASAEGVREWKELQRVERLNESDSESGCEDDDCQCIDCKYEREANERKWEGIKNTMLRVLEGGCVALLEAISDVGFCEVPPFEKGNNFMQAAIRSKSLEMVQVSDDLIVLICTKRIESVLRYLDYYRLSIKIFSLPTHRGQRRPLTRTPTLTTSNPPSSAGVAI